MISNARREVAPHRRDVSRNVRGGYRSVGDAQSLNGLLAHPLREGGNSPDDTTVEASEAMIAARLTGVPLI